MLEQLYLEARSIIKKSNSFSLCSKHGQIQQTTISPHTAEAQAHANQQEMENSLMHLIIWVVSPLEG